MKAHTQTFTLSEVAPFHIIEVDGKTQIANFIQNLYLIKDGVDTIASYRINIEDQELAKSITTTDLEELEGIKAKLKVELTSTACCLSIETYYYLITHDDRIIAFNEIYNRACDGNDPKYDLIFPSDTFGQENSIYLGRIIYDRQSDYSNPIISFVERITEVYPNYLSKS